MPGALQQGARTQVRAGIPAWLLEGGLMHGKVNTRIAHQPMALQDVRAKDCTQMPHSVSASSNNGAIRRLQSGPVSRQGPAHNVSATAEALLPAVDCRSWNASNYWKGQPRHSQSAVCYPCLQNSVLPVPRGHQ